MTLTKVTNKDGQKIKTIIFETRPIPNGEVNVHTLRLMGEYYFITFLDDEKEESSLLIDALNKAGKCRKE